jgi:hypothetical protein
MNREALLSLLPHPRVLFSLHPSLFLKHPKVALISMKEAGVVVKGGRYLISGEQRGTLRAHLVLVHETPYWVSARSDAHLNPSIFFSWGESSQVYDTIGLLGTRPHGQQSWHAFCFCFRFASDFFLACSHTSVGNHARGPGHSLPTLGRAFPLLICLVPTPNFLLQRLNRGNGPSDLGRI